METDGKRDGPEQSVYPRIHIALISWFAGSSAKFTFSPRGGENRWWGGTAKLNVQLQSFTITSWLCLPTLMCETESCARCFQTKRFPGAQRYSSCRRSPVPSAVRSRPAGGGRANQHSENRQSTNDPPCPVLSCPV